MRVEKLAFDRLDGWRVGDAILNTEEIVTAEFSPIWFGIKQTCVVRFRDGSTMHIVGTPGQLCDRG